MTEENDRRKKGVETAEIEAYGDPTKVTSKAFLLLWRIHADLVASPQTPGSSCPKQGVTKEDALRRSTGVREGR